MSKFVYIKDGVLYVSDGTSLGDAAADPSANGEIARNGADVKVYSGGAVRSFSDIGSGGGGLVNVVAELTAEAFSYPKTGITNPFSNAGNEPGALNVDDYAAEAVPLSSASAEPLQFTAKPIVPSGATGLKFTIVVAPQSGQAWDESDIAFDGEAKHVTDGNAWSAVTSFDIVTETVPASGSDVLVLTATIPLATMGLTAGDQFMMCLEVDTTNTDWGNDIAFFSATTEADDS